jgi:hypothetical protein
MEPKNPLSTEKISKREASILTGLAFVYGLVLAVASFNSNITQATGTSQLVVEWIGRLFLVAGFVIEISNIVWLRQGKSVVLLVTPLCFGAYILFSRPTLLVLGFTSLPFWMIRLADVAGLWLISLLSLLAYSLIVIPTSLRSNASIPSESGQNAE